jgi:hypothetical protein
MTSALEGVGDVVPLDPSVLTVSASFFSVPERRLVATVSMEYSGSSLDDASARFAAKIVHALPEVTCAGWNVEPPEDAALVAP